MEFRVWFQALIDGETPPPCTPIPEVAPRTR